MHSDVYPPQPHGMCLVVLQRGMTPLHYAAVAGQASIVVALVVKGANVNAIDKVGHLMCMTLCVDASGHEFTTGIFFSCSAAVVFRLLSQVLGPNVHDQSVCVY
jgi:hypothetical protein